MQTARVAFAVVMTGLFAAGPALAGTELSERRISVINALSRARIDAAQAAELAHKQAGTSTIVGIELKMLQHEPTWSVKVLNQQGASQTVLIQAITGKTGTAPATKQHEPLFQAKITLAKAIQAVQARLPKATVYKVELGATKGQPIYHILLMTADHHTKEADLDADSGRLLQVEDEFDLVSVWTFDDIPVGQIPSRWMPKQNNPTKALATWEVAADADAPSLPNVLAVNTDNGNATFNMLIAENTSFKDLDMQTDIRGNSGTHDQGGGLIWRAKNENNYYVCRMNPLETNFRVYKIEAGKRKQLQTAEIKTETGKWYTLRITMIGDHIQCWLNDAKLLDLHDSTFTEAGMIGLWTKADASSSFDNLVVIRLPQKPTATRPTN